MKGEGSREKSVLPVDRIERAILALRGHRVMLDEELAALYGVETRALVQAVKRNAERFPEDFMFRLTVKEAEALRSHSVISKPGARGGRRHAPYAFTEQGVAMLSSVLRSARAVEVNIAIMRTFVQLRRLMDSNRRLARKIEAMEKKYDEQFGVVFDAIKRLIAEDDERKSQSRRRIGFGRMSALDAPDRRKNGLREAPPSRAARVDAERKPEVIEPALDDV